MKYKLVVNSSNPPTDALIISEIINSQHGVKVEVEWCKNWKDKTDLKFFDESGALIGETSNEVGRYFARGLDKKLYGSTDPRDRTEVDHWLSFVIGSLRHTKNEKKELSYLDHTLVTTTWLVAKKLTLADISVFAALLDKRFIEKYEKQYPNVTRWYKLIMSLSPVKHALSEITKNKINTFDNAQMKVLDKVTTARKQEGKFIALPGAEMGKVVVRFPPEASGYLHIGHAKAALLNQHYAEAFQGQLIMRFDDTNPAKENVEFEKAILEDLELLQIKPDRFTHSSDYFDIMLEYCTKLIKEGKAFVDDTPAEIMKQQRDQRQKSVNRDNSIEKNLELWNEMQKGTTKGQECCIRAKIDYESVNGCMRDPTIYRCKLEPHPRTGTKYKVYPTYDFACPIVDAIENVTHTLRTTEYHDRDPQFYWIIDALGLRRPYIWEYSRLNMTNTVLSKRKLTWFVTEGLVDGWDDPRFPTVRGILRRGMTVEGLKQFIIAQGSSRSVVFMEWDKIWAFNKKVIDASAHRYTALDSNKTVVVNVLDAKEEWLTVQNHPKDPSKGTKRVLAGPRVLIETVDAESLVEGQNATFINWGNILIEKIYKDKGVVQMIDARLNLNDKNYKNTLKITWLAVPNSDTSGDNLVPCYAVYFNHIISKAILGKDDDFKDFVAKSTRTEVQMFGESELKRVKKGEIIQLQRKGFFRCDVAYVPVSPFSSREQPIILFHVPDGHTMSSNTNVANTSEIPMKSEKNQKESAEFINEKIIAQADKVRSMKAEKADKNMIDAEVKVLLALKAEYKKQTGTDWKSNVVNTKPSKANSPDDSMQKLSNEITNKESKIKELEEMLQREKEELSNLKRKCESTVDKDSTQLNDEAKKGYTRENETTNTDEISNEIQKQGDKVRQLKSSKVDKKIIDQEVKILLSLKNDYKAATGLDWKPSPARTNKTTDGRENTNIQDVSDKIQKQGDKVRQLKSNKAEKQIIDQEVKILLSLKSDYKAATGLDWKPSPATTDKTIDSQEKANVQDVSDKIQKQGDKVRQLKSSKADKDVIAQEVKILLGLKAEYKSLTNHDWTPKKSETETLTTIENVTEKNADSICAKIQKQGDKVRELKSSKADKSLIDQEVQILLSLKDEYKKVTGQDWKPSKVKTPSKKTEDSSKKKQNETQNAKVSNKMPEASSGNIITDIAKTGTRLGLEAKKEENFFDWYSQIITKSGMIEYYDVSGCYILRPWSFSIWKIIKDYIDNTITKLGVQECYFPIFVTRAVLEKEKSHIADFAPEVAWVTKCGDSDLAEPIAIRPTSETVMYPAYAKWLRSDTELPLKLNQWNNVVRWEFKDPKPFLRTREFLWQEGHTAFATKEEADEEVLIILDMYARVYQDLLAIPVVKGRKTEKEKFAGGDYTTTVEAFISTSGRAIQGATSHHLGQNFSKMFNIAVEGIADGDEKTYVYQNSWGLTTRTIGVMIMVHGDDKGLVLPPNVASIQAMLVPCGITANTTVEQRDLLNSECVKLMDELTKDGNLRVRADYRANRTPGWKFNHWELKGIPVRIELGPKDLEKKQVTFVRRDTSERITSSRASVREALTKLLQEIQSSMFARAKKNLDEHIKQVENWDDFYLELNKKNLLLAPFCGETLCEDNIKAMSARVQDIDEEIGTLSMGAKSLCIPFEQPQVSLDKLKCIHPDCQGRPKFYTLFGRSY